MNVIEEISLRREDIVNTKQDKISLNKIAVRKGTKPLQRGGLESFQRAGIISGYNVAGTQIEQRLFSAGRCAILRSAIQWINLNWGDVHETRSSRNSDHSFRNFAAAM